MQCHPLGTARPSCCAPAARRTPPPPAILEKSPAYLVPSYPAPAHARGSQAPQLGPRARATQRSQTNTIGDRRRLATLAPYEVDMADILHGAGVESLPPCSAVPILSSLFRMPIPLVIVLLPRRQSISYVPAPVDALQRRPQDWAKVSTVPPLQSCSLSFSPSTSSHE